MTRQRHGNLDQELRELYSEVPAPPGGLVTGRERMLAEAAHLETRTSDKALSAAGAGARIIPRGRRKMNLLLAYKVLAAVMAVVVAVAGAGGGAVLAADSLPGDALYPVKLLSEDIRLAVTPDAAGRAEMAMEYVAVRVQEMERLAQQGEDVPESVVTRMTRQMEQAMAEIARARPEEVPALLDRVMERTRTHQQALEQAATGADEEVQTRLRQASQVMERTRQNAENDPRYLEYQHQRRYEGTAGPHGEASPTPASAGQQIQEQERHQYEGTPGPHNESAPAGEQQEREEEQHRYEGTAGPHGAATPTVTEEPSPQETPSPAGEPQQSREEEQHGYEGTSGPHGEGPSSSTKGPEPTAVGKQGAGNGH